MNAPAVLGGQRAFPEGLPFARPYVPALERVTKRLEPSYERGILTDGPLVAELEERAAEYLGARHVVAVSSCTSGLILVLQALAPKGVVVLPSFTFSASAHAVAWNHLEPRFADCDADSLQLDPVDAERRLVGAGAVMATHVFGAPCAVESVERLADTAGIPILFDAAHAFGAERSGHRVGTNGVAEVFSLSPTKILVAGEGGLVATDRDDLADTLRLGRDYGNPGDYDMRFVGLNARLSELHAALALESFADLSDHLERRRAHAALYRDVLSEIPGLTPQRVAPSDVSTYKDFTIIVDESEYGLSRDVLVRALAAEGVDTRCYFDPPIHRQHAYSTVEPTNLPITDRVSSAVVSLPVFADLETSAVEVIVERLLSFRGAAGEVRRAIER